MNKRRRQLEEIRDEIIKMSKIIEAHFQPPKRCGKYLTISELAKELGIPRGTLYKRVLPYHTIGGEGRKYYIKEEVLEYEKLPIKTKNLLNLNRGDVP
jgi:transposase-like protein